MLRFNNELFHYLVFMARLRLCWQTNLFVSKIDSRHVKSKVTIQANNITNAIESVLLKLNSGFKSVNM